MKTKNVVIGAGFSGSTIARLIAEERDEPVLLVEKRNHIGGNAYDFLNNDGILVHTYGPHLFHTNSKKVFEFLTRFTEWISYEHRVKAFIDGKTYPFPVNIDTINALYGTDYNESNIHGFYESKKVCPENINNAEDMVISRIGYDLYEKFFKNYTKKQWGMWPTELDPEVTARIPVRTNHDDRYFTDEYQYMPKYGYTEMFKRMLDHPNIELMMNVDYRNIRGAIEYERLIYTGPIDEFYDSKLGKLPYRSIDFEFETLDIERFQEIAVVNYPNDYDFTRITEFKHFTGQISPETTIVKEYTKAEGDPYYPVPRRENNELADRYKNLAEQDNSVVFLGRLGEYKYYNMDKAVERAFEVFRSL